MWTMGEAVDISLRRLAHGHPAPGKIAFTQYAQAIAVKNASAIIEGKALSLSVDL